MRRQDLNPNAHWRDSARQVRLFIIDYRATFPLLLFIFFPSINLLIFVACLLVFLFIIERYGYTTVVFARLLRGFLAGRTKASRPWWRDARISE